MQRVLHHLGKDEVDADGIDENGDSPIHAYVRRGDKKRMECLMAFLINAKYKDINAKNTDGDTPLHLACKVKGVHIIIVKPLNKGHIGTSFFVHWSRGCPLLGGLKMYYCHGK